MAKTSAKPKQLTPKREAFAHLVASGESYCNAYGAAGYAIENMQKKTLYAESWKVAHDPAVSARIKELQKQLLTEEHIDRDWLLTRVVKTYERAVESDSLQQQNRSLELVGRILGEFTDKSEVKALVEADVKSEEHKPDFSVALARARATVKSPNGSDANLGALDGNQ